MPSRKSAKNELKPTLLHLRFDPDDEHGLTFGLMISIDPRRIEKGNGPLGDEEAFSVQTWMKPSAFARLLSKLVKFGTLVGFEGQDTVTIEIDSEDSLDNQLRRAS